MDRVRKGSIVFYFSPAFRIGGYTQQLHGRGRM